MGQLKERPPDRGWADRTPDRGRQADGVWPLPGDSLLVYDYQGQRFSAWTRDGQFGRVSPLMPKFLNPPNVRGRLADGSLVFSDVYFDIPGTGFDWVPLVVQAYGVDGVLRDTLREYPAQKFGRLVNAGLVGSPVFYRRTVVFAGEQGLFAGRGEAREIEVSNAAGRITRLIRWTGPPLEVTDAAISRHREQALAAVQDEESRRRIWRMLDEQPVEPTFPVLWDLRVTDDGELWVRRYDRPGDGPEQRWLVFDSDSRLIARITLPEGLEIFRIEGGELLGAETDELDVEYVVAYEIVREP